MTIDHEKVATPLINKELLHRIININRFSFLLADLIALVFVCFCIRPLVSSAQIVWYKTENGAISTVFSGVDPYLIMAICAVIYFQSVGLYSRRRPLWDQLRPVARAVGILFLLDCLVLYLSSQDAPIFAATVSAFSLALLFTLSKIVTRFVLRYFDKWLIPTVIIGTGENAIQTAEAILAEPSMGFEICYFVICPDPDLPSDHQANITSVTLSTGDVPVTEFSPELLASLRHHNGPHVIMALEASQAALSSDLMTSLAVRPSSINVVPPVRGIPLYGLEVNHLLARELLLLHVRNNLARLAPRLLKRMIDFFGAIALVIVLSPVFLFLTLWVLQTGRPIFFGHKRVGKDGKPFRCYKFRSMVTNADQVLKEILENDPAARAEWERDFKLKNDPRITKVGHFLRKSSLDELPQLWNVIRGDMSLVGPRPIIEKEIDYYSADIDYYLMVRPGMTGLWQVSGRNNVDYSHRVFLDTWYVRNWSLWYDFSILLRTFSVVFGKNGAY